MDISLAPGAGEGMVLLTPAFYRAHQADIAHFPPEPHIRLRRARPTWLRSAPSSGALPTTQAKSAPSPGRISPPNVEQATRTESVALEAFALLAALAALVMIGQTLVRELFLATSDHDTLGALGMPRSQRFAATILPVVLVGAVGGLIGAGLAVLASPLTPVGLARRAEPDPGPVVHVVAIGSGVAVTGDWQPGDPSSLQPPELASNPDVGAFSAVHLEEVVIDGIDVFVTGLDTAHAQVFPTIVEGREPEGPDEIAFGTSNPWQLGRPHRRDQRRGCHRRYPHPGRAAAAGPRLGIRLRRLLRPLRAGRRSRSSPAQPPADTIRGVSGRPAAQATHRRREPRPGRRPSPGARRAARPPGRLRAHPPAGHLDSPTPPRPRRPQDTRIHTQGGIRRGGLAGDHRRGDLPGVGAPLGVALGRRAWSLLIEHIGLGAEHMTPHLALLAGALGTLIVANLVFTTRLPYRLGFDTRVTRLEPPTTLETLATGELEGTGRWVLTPDDGGTLVRYNWDVRTTRRWMNLIAPVARPVFTWNHDALMREGGESLARRLGAE